jgi:hypothetical protein
MRAALRESYRARFERNGIVYPIPVLSPEKSAAYVAAFSEIESLIGRPLHRMGNPALHFSWAYRLATEPAVLDAVEAVLGPDLLIIPFLKDPISYSINRKYKVNIIIVYYTSGNRTYITNLVFSERSLDTLLFLSLSIQVNHKFSSN